MPSTSAKQARFMQAVKHSPEFAKKVGVSQSVGAEFVAADKAAGKYAKGGHVCTCSPLNKASGGKVGCPCKEMDMAEGGVVQTKRRAFLENFRRSNPDVQREFVAEHLSLGNPDTTIAFQPPQRERIDPASDMEIIRRHKAKAQAMLRRPMAAGGSVIADLLRSIAPKLSKAKAPLTQVAEQAQVPISEMVRTEGAAMRYPPAQRGAVRLKGGNFNEPWMSEYLGPPESPRLATDEGGFPTEPSPVSQWKMKQLANYLRKDIGSPTDPLLQVEKEYPGLHLPEGVVEGTRMPIPGSYLEEHARLSGGAPLTPWGRYSDRSLTFLNPEEYADEILRQNLAAEPGYAWLSKLPPETKIWGLNDPYEDELGFGHVLDYLNAAKTAHEQVTGIPGGIAALRAGVPGGDPRQAGLQLFDAGLALSPEQISRTSVADAVRKTARWNEFMAKNQEASPDLAKGIKAVHKEYPEEGMKWVELGLREQKMNENYQPVINDFRAGLNAEGKAMGHCVGGYCEEVASRGTKIYSLRDAKGNPHVTIEVKPGRPATQAEFEELDEIIGLNTPYEQEALARLGNDATPMDWLQDVAQNHPRAAAQGYAQRRIKQYAEKPPSIVQIKGKQNAAPVAKYLPFVQDFVKSGQWERVGDLNNTGLRPTNDVFNATEQKTLRNQGVELPPYLTKQETEELQKKFPDFGNSMNYASGGPVVDVGDPARRGARTTWRRDVADVKDAIGGFSDMVSGAARGAAKAAIGWPGDLERLIGVQVPEAVGAAYRAPSGERLGAAAEAFERTAKAPTMFPTMEEVGKALPEATRFSMRPGQTNPFESLTEFAPISPAQVGRAAKFGTSQARKLVDEVMRPVPRGQAQRGAVDVGTPGTPGSIAGLTDESVNRASSDAAAGRVRVVMDKYGNTRALTNPSEIDKPAYAGEVIWHKGIGRDEWTPVTIGEGVGKSSMARMRENLKSWNSKASGGSVKSRALTLVDKEMDPIERLGHMCDVAMTE